MWVISETKERTLAFRISTDMHMDIKIKIAKEGITLKDYVLGLIGNDLYNSKFDIDVKKAQNALENMRNEIDMLSELLKVNK